MNKSLLRSGCFLLTLLLMPLHASAGEINISAAASLKEVMNELADRFARSGTGVKFVKNYGGSGLLAKQIEGSAPADIFISANREWMEYLKERRLVDAPSIEDFAFNTLVFAGSTRKKVTGMQGLAALERIAIGSPKSVPAGEYATEAMQKAGVEKQLAGRVILAKDVREALMYAERGEVDGAFVYHTDALQARQVRILFTVPQQLYPRVAYPMALTSTGARKKEAAEFIRFLKSKEAKEVLARHGFAPK